MKAWLQAATVLLAFSAFALSAQEEDANAVETQPPVPIINPEKSRDALEQAYQKEYAFLEAQLRDLRQRLNAFESQAVAAEQQKDRPGAAACGRA